MDHQLVTGTGPEQGRRMRELAARLWGWSSRWHPGELAWFWWEHGGPLPEWRLATWSAGGRTVAWAWSKADGRLDLQVDPAHLELLPEVLAWFDAAAGAGARTVTVLDAESALVDRLLGERYLPAPAGQFFVHLRRPLSDLRAPAPLPQGFSLRPVRGEPDAAARAAVHRAAFRVDLTTEAYRSVMADDQYQPGLDWLVVAPDGTPAAFCLSWFDDRSRAAVLEPVGTDPRFRRLGLARAAVLASLRAAAALGGRHARVCARGDDGDPAPRATYTALGFRAYARNVSLVREPAQAPPR